MARRHEILALIAAHKVRSRGDGPSYRVLRAEARAAGLDLGLATIRHHVRRLVADGLLLDPDRTDGKLILPESRWVASPAGLRLRASAGTAAG